LRVGRESLLEHVHHCESCGLSPVDRYGPDAAGVLQVRVRVPVADGGKLVLDNMVVLCPTCHRLMDTLMNADKRLLDVSQYRRTLLTSAPRTVRTLTHQPPVPSLDAEGLAEGLEVL